MKVLERLEILSIPSAGSILSRPAAHVIFLVGGLLQIRWGFTPNSGFISESDIPATQEERDRAHPTVLKRVVVVGFGVFVALYGVLAVLSDLGWR